MIAYFDTSALVPLLVDEPTSALCNRVWTESTRVLSTRLIYPEERAALARTQRMGRLIDSQLDTTVAELDSLVDEVDVIELSAEIARSAGHLAQQFGLRGYDAMHLAAALVVVVADDDLVLVTGALDLASAAHLAGVAVSIARN